MGQGRRRHSDQSSEGSGNDGGRVQQTQSQQKQQQVEPQQQQRQQNQNQQQHHEQRLSRPPRGLGGRVKKRAHFTTGFRRNANSSDHGGGSGGDGNAKPWSPFQIVTLILVGMVAIWTGVYAAHAIDAVRARARVTDLLASYNDYDEQSMQRSRVYPRATVAFVDNVVPFNREPSEFTEEAMLAMLRMRETGEESLADDAVYARGLNRAKLFRGKFTHIAPAWLRLEHVIETRYVSKNKKAQNTMADSGNGNGDDRGRRDQAENTDVAASNNNNNNNNNNNDMDGDKIGNENNNGGGDDQVSQAVTIIRVAGGEHIDSAWMNSVRMPTADGRVSKIVPRLDTLPLSPEAWTALLEVSTL